VTTAVSSRAPALAPGARATLDRWYGFVKSGEPADLAPLLARDIVFRSPFVHNPLPGHPAAMLILTTVSQIFEDFQYHREFVAAPFDAALEFSAHIGDWQLKGIDLVRFNDAGEMVEFEVMIRPFKALQALGEAMTARIGPQLAALKAGGRA
jgi:hypothetical protein